MLKKVCSVILVFALLVSGITYSNGYVNEADASVYEDIYIPGYTCLYIQPCGDNCSLYAYKDGICVVRGSGPMWDDFEVDDEIMSGTMNYPGMRYVIFEEGITNIGGFNKDSKEGYYAEIPEGAEYLQDYAFANSNLLNILFDGAIETGKAAFMNCTSLVRLYFPDGITELREHVGDGCTSLECIYVPASVTAFYGSAFINCTRFKTIYYGGETGSDFSFSATLTPFLDEDGTYYYIQDPEIGRWDFYHDPGGSVLVRWNYSSGPEYEDDVQDGMQEVAHNRVLGIDDEYPFETPAEAIIGTIEDILNSLISSATFTTDNKYSVSNGASGSYGTSSGTSSSTSNIGSTSSGTSGTATSSTGSASGGTSSSYSTENTHADAMDNAFNNTSIKAAKKTSKKLTINVKKATYEYSNVTYNAEVYKTKKAAKKGKKPIATKKSSSKKIVIKSKKVNKAKKVFVKVRASRPYTANNKTKTVYGNWSKIKKVK